MYRSSPCCSTLNRNVGTASLAQGWACVKFFVPKQSMPCRSTKTLNTIYITSLGMSKECTEAVHAVALVNTNVSTGLGVCEISAEDVHAAAL